MTTPATTPTTKMRDRVVTLSPHYDLANTTSPAFVYASDGNEFGVVFLRNGHLHFIPRDAKASIPLPEGILPRSVSTNGGESKPVKIMNVVAARSGPFVAVEWELPQERGQILLLKICLPDSEQEGASPFVEVLNTGSVQASEKHQRKHFLGGFDQKCQLIFYALSDWDKDASWRVKRVVDGGNVEEFGDAGYHPEHLGFVADRPVWSNRHGRWRCGLNDTDPQPPYYRYRAAGQDASNLLVLRDDQSDHETWLGKVTFIDDAIEFSEEKLLSHDSQIVQQVPNPYPSGEVTHVSVSPKHGAFIVFNDDHGSQLSRLNSGGGVEQIDFSDVVDGCNGPVSIAAIATSHDRIAIEVSNFNTRNQIWVSDLDHTGGLSFQPLLPDLQHRVEGFHIDCEVRSTPVQISTEKLVEFNYFDLSAQNQPPPRRTVVYIHGGPAVRLKLEHKPDIAALIQEGYRVIAPNVPGSAGQGGWFAGLDDGVDARLALFETAWVPFLEALHHKYGPLCLYGGSYAGWVIAKILTTSAQRFVGAALVRNGVTDWDVFVKNTAPFRKRNRYTEYFGEPDPDPEALPGLCEALNPSGVSNVDPRKVRFVVGLSDTRVPPDCTEAFVNQAWPNVGPAERDQMIHRMDGQGHQIRGKEVQMDILQMAIDLFDTVA
jgi:dipeptidyl aminopeptidase/acylaminoacyl peptidase